MTNFPRNDFALAKYLLEANKVNTPVCFELFGILYKNSKDMRRVMAIGAMLESCNFVLFWRLVNGRYRPSESPDEPYKRPDEIKQTVESVQGFKEAVRICQFLQQKILKIVIFQSPAK